MASSAGDAGEKGDKGAPGRPGRVGPTGEKGTCRPWALGALLGEKREGGVSEQVPRALCKQRSQSCLPGTKKQSASGEAHIEGRPRARSSALAGPHVPSDRYTQVQL